MAFSLDQLLHELTAHGIDPGNASFVCALSGGMDSMVLLDAMTKLKASLRCVHVHHGLNASADDWAEHCERQAQQRQCPFIVHRVSVVDGDNLEERCRQARYQILAEELQPHEVLLTAHHRDDQAETVLLQLLRGAGVAGLSAMPETVVPFAAGRLFRPLLGHSRMTLQAFAQENHLSWISDDTNDDHRFDRNYLRTQVVPELRSRWPSLDKTIARSARCMQEAQQLLDELAVTDIDYRGSERCICIAELHSLSTPRVVNALRYWLQLSGVRRPNRERMLEAVRQFQLSESDKAPVLQWSEGAIQRYRGALYFFDPEQCNAQNALSEQPDSNHLVSDCWVDLPRGAGRFRYVGRPVSPSAQIASGSGLSVQFRQGGEVLNYDDGRHHPLKLWFQEHAVPPLMRACVPLVFKEGELVAIADVWIERHFAGTLNNTGLYFEWESTLSDFISKD